MPFLLTTEPWIPCVDLRGNKVELGIRETFARAHDLAAVNDASPLVTLALHRLLLAFLHRVFGPPDLATWRSLFEKRRFPMEPLDTYLDAQRARLDLIHPERPFYQTRGLPTEYEPDGIGRLIFERSNYGAPSGVFQHRPESFEANEAITFAESARALVALHAFAPGGLVKKRGEPDSATAGPLNRGAFVLIQGNTLFETLLWNLLVYSPKDSKPIPGDREKDSPCWEQAPLARPAPDKEPKRRPSGWVDLLTWQSRRLELALTPDGSAVRGVTYCVGQGLEDEGLLEPMLAYRKDDKRGLVAIDLSENRLVFRDCHAFIRFAEADGAQPPKAIEQASRRELRSLFNGRTTLQLAVMGLRGDQAKLKLSRAESLDVPVTILGDPDRVAAVMEATAIAETSGSKLRFAARIAAENALAPGDRQADKNDISNLADRMDVERAYWGALHSAFQGLLAAVAADSADAVRAFFGACRLAALASLRNGAEALGTSARQLQAAARAESWLRRELASIAKEKGHDT